MPALAAAIGISGSVVLAQDGLPLEPQAAQPADIFSRNHATGDWFGMRDAMARHGIVANVNLIADYSYNFSGGRRRGDAFRHLLDFGLEMETEPLIGLKGGRFFVGALILNGHNGTEDLAGDFQGFGNIDADGFTQVAEMWYEQMLWDDRLRIKVGKVDANSEFAYVEYGGEFLNSSPGFSPTLLALPSYPDPATSISIFVYPSERLYAGFGLYDGATQDGGFGRTGNRGPSTLWGEPADLFLIGEAGMRWTLGQNRLSGRLGLGTWRHTGRFERFDGGSEGGTAGFYAVLDQLVWRENPGDEEDEQGIGLFAQLGWADPELSEVDQHIGLGMVWSGALPGRNRDVVGLMASAVRFTDERAAGFANDYETAVETFYKIQLTTWFSLKADLQYIFNPGGGDADDAVVGTLRAELSF